MQRNNSSLRRRISLFVLGVSYSLILLAVLAGCVAVTNPPGGIELTVDALRQDVQSLQTTVPDMDARLRRLEATPQPTVTIIPTPASVAITWIGGGVALAYSPTITPAVALYPAHHVQVFSNLETFLSEWITPSTTIQMALLSPVSSTYELAAVDTLRVGHPTTWHQYSSGIVMGTVVTATASYTSYLLGVAQPISQSKEFGNPANQDLQGSLKALSNAGFDMSVVKYAQILLLDQSQQSSQSVLVIIDPDAPSSGDRIRKWCQKSCRFQWCSWFCRLKW
jgi:hypothetical protein